MSREEGGVGQDAFSPYKKNLRGVKKGQKLQFYTFLFEKLAKTYTKTLSSMPRRAK